MDNLISKCCNKSTRRYSTIDQIGDLPAEKGVWYWCNGCGYRCDVDEMPKPTHLEPKLLSADQIEDIRKVSKITGHSAGVELLVSHIRAQADIENESSQIIAELARDIHSLDAEIAALKSSQREAVRFGAERAISLRNRWMYSLEKVLSAWEAENEAK